MTSSEDGLSLPGANVIVSGTNIGTTTDFDGHFTLNKVDVNATLIFSFSGFTNQTIPVNGLETINVVLKSESKQLT